MPPFGEAHNHNVDYSTPRRTDSLLTRYVRDGVFYVKNPGNLPRGRDSLAGRVNVPHGVDAVFANGLLTATGGHPTGLYLRNLSRGAMTAADSVGGFLWIIDSLPDLERKWPRIVAGRPDFIKVVLIHSEEFARRRTDSASSTGAASTPRSSPRSCAARTPRGYASPRTSRTRPTSAPRSPAAWTRSITSPASAATSASSSPTRTLRESTAEDAKLAAARGMGW